MNFIFLLIFIIHWISPSLQQPRIFSKDGNLHISPAADKNVVIRCDGKSNFFVNNVNVLDSLRNVTKKYDDRYESQLELTKDIENIRNVLHTLNNQMNIISNRTQTSNFQDIPRIQRRLRNAQSSIRALKANIDLDECSSDPCKNGGTCVDLYKRFHCLCPEGWAGASCEMDIDECYGLAGTDLGCQNKADCINTPGSYRCHCKEGYTGVHCTQRSSSCTPDSCGHGFCVPANNEHGISCICDQGWKKAEDSPQCSVDVNECETSNPCHTFCTNLPGSFACGPCPSGYEGNGIFCKDVNECETNNGGCSLSPKVQCINTEGSHHCGPCPPGWAGDGKYCTISDENTCGSNSICHPLAKCQYISNTAICICPDHMTGLGYGPSGCVTNENHPCKDKPCKNNGTCIANGNTFTCLCQKDYHPPRCEYRDPCALLNPCKNGGICSTNPNNTRLYTCSCSEEFVGLNCERTIGQCGGYLREPTGSIRYPFEGNYHPRTKCAWLFYLNYPKVLNITFSKFDLEPADSSGECAKDFLQIHDGMNSQSQVLGRLCGKQDIGNIISSDRIVYMYFSSDNTTEGTGFELSWNLVDVICGGVLNDTSGFIKSPGFPGKSPPKRDCKWRIEAPFGKRIMFKFFKIEFENSLNCTGDHLTIFDGKENLEDSVLEKICSTSIPSPVLSTSHIAIVNFHTDPHKSDSSFNLHYEIVDAEPDCGGLYTGTKGSFNIFTRSNCEFLIKVPDGMTAVVTLENHDFKNQDFICAFNFFDLIDGLTPESPLIERYCLGDGKKTFKTSTNSILIKTTSKLSLNRLVSVTYEVLCDQSFNELEGVITTPNYPGQYFKDLSCTYTIHVDLGYRVELKFEDFDLPRNKSADGKCLEEADDYSFLTRTVIASFPLSTLTLFNIFPKISLSPLTTI